jgi:hypothetical protein
VERTCVLSLSVDSGIFDFAVAITVVKRDPPHPAFILSRSRAPSVKPFDAAWSQPICATTNSSSRTADPKGSIRLSLFSIRPSISTEDFIPEEMDNRKIAVRVPMMNEVQFLFPSEPCKPLKPRSLYVVFLVEEDVRVERCRTCDYLNHEEIDWQ